MEMTMKWRWAHNWMFMLYADKDIWISFAFQKENELFKWLGFAEGLVCIMMKW